MKKSDKMRKLAFKLAAKKPSKADDSESRASKGPEETKAAKKTTEKESKKAKKKSGK